ncbi:hypothetical protein [Hoyosella altamirensis]|uniref:Uncharacterized protein n=1 Tax=Hoyosella altamirensis TaxID=616997 RepID=A0A839RWL1_9ACTN|nr:hypothetical protein [Hoyosella altamirensis]MBB3040131.1 hypothetical protein [Hoyosella altamirensis]
MSDVLLPVVGRLQESLRQVFSNSAPTPPLGGGSDEVRFVAGDFGLSMSMWNLHQDDCGCGDPFLWVRIVRRYRTSQFPADQQGGAKCGTSKAATIEAGVARCAVTEPNPCWDELDREALVSADDSWRLEAAMCRAIQCATREHLVLDHAQTPIVPVGPEGGLLAWIAQAHVQLGASA